MRDYLWYVPPAAIHKAAPHSESRKHSYTIFTKTVEKNKIYIHVSCFIVTNLIFNCLKMNHP